MNKFGIHIKVQNIEKSFKFYTSLGFKPVFAYGNDEWQKKIKSVNLQATTVDEKYDGVTFEYNDALLEIANGHMAIKPEVFMEKIVSSKVSAMLDTDSVDKIVEICKKNGLEIAVDVREFPWGTKEVVLRDPDGFILVFRERNYNV